MTYWWQGGLSRGPRDQGEGQGRAGEWRGARGGGGLHPRPDPRPAHRQGAQQAGKSSKSSLRSKHLFVVCAWTF